MKLIIDVPDNVYAKVMEYYEHNEIVEAVYGYIYRGTPIPDNATNGDAMKAMFPNERIYKCQFGYDFEECSFDEEWWNAPYQKGDKE